MECYSLVESTSVGLRHLYQGSEAENVCPRATENSPRGNKPIDCLSLEEQVHKLSVQGVQLNA